MKKLRTAAAIVLLRATAAHGTPVLIDFDTIPTGLGVLPPNQYSPQGVSIWLEPQFPWGPAGNGWLSTSSASNSSVPPPASGTVLVPYANLAGWLGAFDFTFSTPVDSFGLYAFGPQAFSVLGYRNQQLVTTLIISAQEGRTSILAQLGSVSGPTTYDLVRVIPTNGSSPIAPATGPLYYDLLSFNTVPAPTGLLLLGAPVLMRRRAR